MVEQMLTNESWRHSSMEPLEEGEINYNEITSLEMPDERSIQSWLSRVNIILQEEENKKQKDEKKDEKILEEQACCCICMTDFDENSRISTLKCGHKFCTDCILENIASAVTNKHQCPLCRADMCSKISNPREDQLRLELNALENTLDDKTNTLSCVNDAMIYYHDQYLMKKREIETRKNIYKRELSNVWNALNRVQSKLNKEIEENMSETKYKTCSKCGMKGHFSKMCGKEAKTAKHINSLEQNISSIIRKQNDPINQDFIPYKDILKSILPRGNMFWIINNHFDQNDYKQYSEDEIRGMYQQYSFALNDVGEGEISHSEIVTSIVEM